MRGTTQPITGLDDKAVGDGLEIAVQSGNYVMNIRNADSPGFGKWPKSTALANAIIAGLHSQSGTAHDPVVVRAGLGADGGLVTVTGQHTVPVLSGDAG